MKASDLDVQILATLWVRCRFHNDKGAGIYLLQKAINKSKTSNKFLFDDIFRACKSLEKDGYVRYHKIKYWILTEQGKETCKNLEKKIGRNFQSLKIKINNCLN